MVLQKRAHSATYALYIQVTILSFKIYLLSDSAIPIMGKILQNINQPSYKLPIESKFIYVNR